MGEAVDFDKLLDVDVNVNLGGVQARVAEHLLDPAFEAGQVGPVLQHERGNGVAEQMATGVPGGSAAVVKLANGRRSVGRETG